MSAFYGLVLFCCFFTADGENPSRPLSQEKYPQDYFRLPLNLPVSLSGNFGELRSNHFHTGLDFRTQQSIGHPVYASASGYVSRILASGTGYGRAVYITHPNGYTTVYGHLSKYQPEIENFLREYQYANKTFRSDVKVPKNLIMVHKGDKIALSGNSGGSGGPHLHFEIRDTQTEEAINPLLFGLPVPDQIRPTATGLYLYPLNANSSVDGSKFKSGYSLGYTGNGHYGIENKEIIPVSGEIGIGINAYDKHTGSPFKQGIFSVEMKVDGQTAYLAKTDRLIFSNSRAMNSHMDYPSYVYDDREIIRCYVEEGNPLQIYQSLSNKGVLAFGNIGQHHVSIILKDAKGNTSTVDFIVTNTEYIPKISPAKPNFVKRFLYDEANNYQTKGFKIEMPTNTLYKNIDFTFTSGPGPEYSYSRTYFVHDKGEPVNNYFDIYIKPEPGFTRSDKAVIVNQDGDAMASTFQNGWVKARVREFGAFHLVTDPVPPSIRPVTIADGKDMKGNSGILLKVDDELSGIKSIKGTIDGKWVLMEQDPKSNSLIHRFDWRTSPGKHTFKLIVTDNKDNFSTYEAVFYR